jgi:glycosyltransferase involved in cell wall biosynthesis
MSKRLWHIAYKKGNYTEKFFWTVKGFIERVFLLFSLPKYDTVYIFMNVFPFGPAILERLYRALSRRIIYDVEDNIISDEPHNDRRIIDFLKSKKKYEFLIKKSDVVITSSPDLAEKCNQISGSNKSVFIPSTLNEKRFLPRTSLVHKEKLTIGWTGTFSSKPYLDIVLPALEALYKERDFKIKIIGNFEMENPALDLEVVQWNKENEVRDLQDIDIGLYPLPINEWVSGKDGLKAMLYMSIGIPAVCTAVGNVLNIVNNGVDGILVFEESEWKEKLKDIIDDEKKRKIIGENARKTFLTKFSKKSITKLYLKALA